MKATFRSSAGPVAWLAVARIGASALVFGMQVFLARSLDRSDYGVLLGALAALNLMSGMVGLGVGQFWLRAFGKEGWRATRWLAPSVRLVALAASLSLALVILVAVISGFGLGLGGLILWLWPLLLAQVMLNLGASRLLLEERYEAAGSIELARPSLLAIGALAVLIFDMTFANAIATLSVSGLIAAAIIGSTVRDLRHLRLVGHGPPPPPATGPSPRVRDVLGNSWPFAGNALAFAIFFQADLLLLNWLGESSEAAVYGVAVAALATAYQVPVVVYARYLRPKFNRWIEHEPDRFDRAYRRGLWAMPAFGAVLWLVAFVAATTVVPAIFGERFAESADLLRWLAAVIPARFLSVVFVSQLVSVRAKARQLRGFAVAGAINVAMNVVLIPRYGYAGAAWATIVAEYVALAIFAFEARRNVQHPDEL